MDFFKEAIYTLQILVRALHGNPRDGWQNYHTPHSRTMRPVFDSRRFLCNRRKTGHCNRKTTA